MGQEVKAAFLWDEEVEWDRKDPFGGERSKDFAKYTELGHEYDLKIFMAKYKWYQNGELRKAFHWNGENWEKIHDIELEVIYDKFKFNSTTREIKEGMFHELAMVNNPELEEICKDKLRTYEMFPDIVGETKIATRDNAQQMLEKYGKFVFKPRFGFAGKGVDVIESMENFQQPDNPENFIVQQFISTDGYPDWGVQGPHDLRTIIIDGEIQDGNYVRVPDEGLISNISRGGSQMYVDKDELPEEVIEIIEDVKNKFKKYQPAIFSVDFMFDEDLKPWVVELNSKPGTYYHHPVKSKEKEIPKIRNILKTLKKRAK